MSSKSETLKNHIISLSEANTFEEAKKEWEWSGVSYAEDWDKCLCAQAIKNIYHIKNTKNDNKSHVGSECINKFFGIKTGPIQIVLKELAENNDLVIPLKLIEHAYEMRYLHFSEVKFLKTLAKGKNWKLSDKQKTWRDKIVWRILNKIHI